MPTTVFSVWRLADHVRRLVSEENLRLVKSWRERLRGLSRCCDPWAAQALSGEHGPRISRLLVEIPCFEPLPFRSLFHAARVPAASCSRVTVGTPGFLRRRLNLYRLHTLCIEASVHGAEPEVRIDLTGPRPSSSENNTKG